MLTKHSTSRTVIVEPGDNISALTVEYYRQELRALIENDYRSVLFDMKATDFVSSSVLGLLVELYNMMRGRNGTFRLINCREPILALLRQTQLNRLLLDGEDVPRTPETKIPAELDSLHRMMSDEIMLLTLIKHTLHDAAELDDPEAIGRVFLNGLARAVGARFGVLLLATEAREALRIVEWVTLDEAAAPEHPAPAPFELHPSECALLAGDDLTLVVSAAKTLPREALCRRLGFEHLLMAEIRGKRGQLGVVILEASARTHETVELARPLVTTFTASCGVTLERALLHRQVAEQRDQLDEALTRVRKSHQSLINAGRLAALGAVISGLGHQLNNKMVPIMGYAQMLAADDSVPAPLGRKIKAIHEASADIHMIISKLLKVSRVRESLAQTFNPIEAFEIAGDLLVQHTQDSAVEIDLRLAPDPVLIQGDPELFLQALLAILHRALTSFPEESKQRQLRVYSVVGDATFRMIFEDNGEDPDVFDNEDWLDPLVPFDAMKHGRIFNYTIPRSVIRRHQGKLEVMRCESGGKRVVIDLPVAKAKIQPIEVSDDHLFVIPDTLSRVVG